MDEEQILLEFSIKRTNCKIVSISLLSILTDLQNIFLFWVFEHKFKVDGNEEGLAASSL